MPFIGTIGWRRDCLNSGVKRVTVDLRAEMRRLLSCAQSATSSACSAKAAAARSTTVSEAPAVKSSA